GVRWLRHAVGRLAERRGDRPRDVCVVRCVAAVACPASVPLGVGPDLRVPPWVVDPDGRSGGTGAGVLGIRVVFGGPARRLGRWGDHAGAPDDGGVVDGGFGAGWLGPAWGGFGGWFGPLGRSARVGSLQGVVWDGRVEGGAVLGDRAGGLLL